MNAPQLTKVQVIQLLSSATVDERLKIVGVFDLECAGILDIHEDRFRLSLMSEDLLEQVMATYANLPGQTRVLDRGRIAIHYRAFLFHLMAGKTGERLEHLKRMLATHVERYAAPYGDLDSVDPNFKA